MSSTSADTGIKVSGNCYCGTVTFSVNLPADSAPIFTAYCHCDSCRRAHAAPLYHVVCIDESMFAIETGAADVIEFQKPGAHILRAFCGTCGSRVFNRFPDWKPKGLAPLAFFPSLLQSSDQSPLPEPFRPQKNNQSGECVLDWTMLQKLGELPPLQ